MPGCEVVIEDVHIAGNVSIEHLIAREMAIQSLLKSIIENIQMPETEPKTADNRAAS